MESSDFPVLLKVIKVNSKHLLWIGSKFHIITTLLQEKRVTKVNRMKSIITHYSNTGYKQSMI